MKVFVDLLVAVVVDAVAELGLKLAGHAWLAASNPAELVHSAGPLAAAAVLRIVVDIDATIIAARGAAEALEPARSTDGRAAGGLCA